MRALRRPAVVRPGDRVRFDGQLHTVVGLSGVLVRLADQLGRISAMHLPTLMTSEGFEVVGSGGPAPVLPAGLLDGVAPDRVEKALWWHGHMTELLTGLPPDAPAGAVPKAEFDPATQTLTQREAAKAVELSTETGRRVSPHTVRWRRRRYQQQGVLGMVDGHAAPRRQAAGQVDPRVVGVLRQLMNDAASRSTHTVSYYFEKVGQAVARLDGPPAVMPSRATFYRLFDRLDAGRHTTGSARTRRALANQPDRVFEDVVVCRPGELMEIDSTPFDVMVRLENGVVDRVEMTGLVDIATRTIAAAVLRPTTKSVDAALLLARSVTPAPMRPGWPQALRMEYSALPYRRLLSVDERLQHAAAVPLIIPEAIVVDGGKAFLSKNFHTACNAFGTEVVHTPPRTPTHKPHVERTLGSAASLFAQFLSGYTGRSAEHRGRKVEDEPLWSLHQLQELLQEWIVLWQNRPHDSLRDPLAPGRTFSPNEKYASLVETAGYLHLPLSAEDYLELLPARWQAVNSYGLKINHRIYDCDELVPLRRQKSGIAEHDNRWEVRHDPYDIRLVWLRDHIEGRWITVPWRLLGKTATPFGELAWDHSVRDLRDQGLSVTEDALAAATRDLLERASQGPPESPSPRRPRRRDRSAKVAARTEATGEPAWPRPAPPAPPDPPDRPAAAPLDGGEEMLADIVPLKVFDARREAKKWW
ncbi:Mu transposase C-terminal domain-containing protein [Kitasatospora sp. NPDC098663]|uniref:Mu transposase C-terminal domain-containing protein n=1 Tax=Kitasatospora sp. NPDC098663 TaxID=3364096 RepID=UPI00382801D7